MFGLTRKQDLILGVGVISGIMGIVWYRQDQAEQKAAAAAALAAQNAATAQAQAQVSQAQANTQQALAAQAYQQYLAGLITYQQYASQVPQLATAPVAVLPAPLPYG